MTVRIRVSTWRFDLAMRLAQAGVWFLSLFPRFPWAQKAALAIYAVMLRNGLRLLRFRFEKDELPAHLSADERAIITMLEREAKLAQWVLGVLVALMLVLFLVGCAHPRTPDPRPTPPPVLSAHLVAFPQVTIAWRPVTLRAWVDDPDSVFPCPSWTWTWPNGTHTGRSEDCDPEERATRHYGGTFIIPLPSGLHLFRIEFRSQGRSLVAQTEVPVR
jgi:hypothetical protein